MAERKERKLSIWSKVEECEKSLQHIHEIDARVDKLLLLERILNKQRELNKP